jgi:hypothetical protein
VEVDQMARQKNCLLLRGDKFFIWHISWLIS